MDLPQEVHIFTVSLTAPFVLYGMNNISAFQEPLVVLALGGIALLTVLFLAHLSVRHIKTVDPLFYVFALFSFTCVVGLTNALEQDGYIAGFMGFYMRKGEPYLSTAYAIMMSYWDGVVHFILLLLMVHHMFRGKPFRNLALFWAGSMIANQLVFIPGIVIGKHGKNIYPAFWRNTPFLLLPIWAAAKLLHRPRELPIITADKIAAEQKKGLFSRPIDLLLTVGLLGTMAFTIFRGFVVLECPLDNCFTYIYQYEPYLKDNVGFPKVMMLVFLFYALPLLAAFVCGLYIPGCTWMLDWTMIFAGALAQAQWCHIGASLHSRTPFTYRVPRDVWRVVMTLNVLYMVLPLILALRCHTRAAFFLKAVPQGQANDKKKK
ncbi:transmembrane 6 superfamily member 2 [Chanos chanos]|uniref:Transmembrane 6 superfamily member 2 n=1 Tax=Chanos chanos TaxID=29144 RepID=A0A6J2VD59_CHACN|nr:transmembrane 6 superfamily member 2-like [Chanos chanos]